MTLLVKNVQIVGGPPDLPERVDVFISGDKISAIGSFSDKKADQIIDGQGANLAPGFIDVNTDSDHYLSLFDNPSQEDFVRQGVTTIVGGHCGSSLAPLLYGSLESIQKWADTRQVNVDWHTIAEFLSMIEKKQLGVNFMTVVGHSTIRRALIGESLRDLTKNELVVFGETVRKALVEGAAGFSTGLAYVHSRQTPYQEVKYLTKIVKDYGGVYTTHLRKSGTELPDSIDETIRIGQDTGASVLISHFQPIMGAEKEYESALDRIGGLPADWDFHFDMYPFETSVLPLYTFLPLWVQNGGVEVMNSNIRDSWLQQRIVKDLPKIKPNDFVVAQAINNDALVGQSLSELMESYYIADPGTALLKLMLSTNLKASILYKNINADLIRRGLLHPRSFVSSNAASFGEKRKMEKPERASQTFTKFLSLIDGEKLMPLKEGIRKITSEPARKFKIRNRGEIKEGNFADLVCFRGSEIRFTIINGVVEYKDGAMTGVLAGKPLKHHGY